MSYTAQHALSTRSPLLIALEKALEEGRLVRLAESNLGLADALSCIDIEVATNLRVEAIDELNRLAEGLDTKLIEDERFPGNESRFLRGAYGATSIYPYQAGLLLLQRAFRTGSAEEAIEWLRKVLTATEAKGKTIQALWGVPVTTEIELANGVRIMPVSSLPDSEEKRQLTSLSSRHGRNIWSSLDFSPPESALVRERCLSPVTFDPMKAGSFDDVQRDADALFSDITLALTVVGPRIAIAGAQWFTFDDSDFDLHRAQAFSVVEVLPARMADYPALNGVEAVEIVGAFLRLEGKTRRKVKIALERINQAQRRHGVGDRAVDLSTAFEAILGDDKTTEMTHKVKVRCVRLLGGSDSIRKTNFLVMGKMYNVRSSLVHSGEVKPGATETLEGVRVPVSDIVDRAIVLCVQLTKAIIRSGEIPNWDVFDITENFAIPER